MAYLGRPGATAPLTTADIPDNSITAAKIVADTIAAGDIGNAAVGTAEIADDAVTGAKIENNPTIAGNLTVSGDLVPSSPLSHRNMVINGAMQVAQRGNGPGTVTGGTGGCQSADRFVDYNNLVAANVTRETTNGVLGTETGNTFNDVFPCSWKWASTTSDGMGAGNRLIFMYRFEGQDLQHLAKGTANAKAVTLSFWVKSTQTGNHQVNITDDNSRMIGAVYAVSSANTWEKKVITFAGDTTGGTIDNDNTQGMAIEWWLSAGSNYNSGAVPTSWEAETNADRNAGGTINTASGTSNYFQITGVQLELGSNATPFEHRSYGDELARCQRYYEKGGDSTVWGHPINRSGTGYRRGHIWFKVTKRVAPTVYTVTSSGSVDGSQSHTTAGMIAMWNSVADGNHVEIQSWTAGSEL